MIGKDSVSSFFSGRGRERKRDSISEPESLKENEQEKERPRSTQKYHCKLKIVIKSLLGVLFCCLNYLECLLTFIQGI